MDLRSGTLLWPTLSRPEVFAQPLEQPLDCHALILGAGVTGAMLAGRLSSAGIDCAVVDPRGIARGSTPASTALIQYEIDTPLVELIRLHGLAAAQAAYRASATALNVLSTLIRENQIDCDLQPVPSLFLASYAHDIGWFKQEVVERRRIGLEVELLDCELLKRRLGFHRPGAIRSQLGMRLDPYKLTQGLFRAARSRGVRIFQAEVTPQQCLAAGHTLRTTQGVPIRCRHLLIATGYETPELFSGIREHCTVKSTYALASAIGSAPWSEDMLIWESARPYFYARRTSDGRVIMGGEDEEVVTADERDAMIESKRRILMEKFAQLFPQIDLQPEFAWAGTFAETSDGLPLIGSPHAWPNCHFALGYGGNGITFSVIASEIIRDAILGKPNDKARLFGFERLG